MDLIKLSLSRAVRYVTMFSLLFAMTVPAWSAVLPALPSSGSTNDKAQSKPAQVDYQALADMLADPKARQALIDQLQQLAKTSGQPGVAKSVSSETVKDHSIAGHLADLTMGLFTDLSRGAQSVVVTAQRLYALDASQLDWRALPNVVLLLGGLVLGTYLLLWLVAYPVRRVLRRLDGWAGKASHNHQLLRVVVSLVLMAVLWTAVIGGIYLLGNAQSLLLSSKVGIHAATLFLNAFFIIELSRLALRLVLTPRYPGLRLLPVSQAMARYWANWASVMLWSVGYTTLFLVPILKTSVDADAALSARWLVSVFALVYTIYAILRQRRKVAKTLWQMADGRRNGPARWMLELFSGTWHLWAIAYFLMVFVVAVTRPGDALPFVAKSTGLSLVVIAAGLLISAMLGQLADSRIRLSEAQRQRMPLLERRLNAYLPIILRVIRVAIALLVVVLLSAIWHLASPFAWLSTDNGQIFLSKTIDILLIVTLALASWLVIASLIEAKLNAEADRLPSARVKTLLTLFRNAVAIALSTMTVMIVLSELGVNIGPLLAGAGVLGLAIGFGAQKLVQDVITGIFIQLENAINTGDIIRVGGIQGTVERLSIRSVGVRDLEGTFHIVPFSSVDVVSNFMRDFAYHKGEYGIAYRENVDEAIAQLRAAFDELYSDPDWQPKILEPILIPGVTALADSSVNIRAMIKTTPGDQWAVGRAYNRLVKMYFDAAGIEIPFPHTTVYFGIDKDGSSPPANLRLYRGGKLPEPAPEPSAKGVPIPDPSNRPEERVPSQSDIDGGPDN